MSMGPSLLDLIPALAESRRILGEENSASCCAVERADASDPASTAMVRKCPTSVSSVLVSL